MQVTLTVQADALSPEALNDLTRDLCQTLNREANVRASLAEAPASPGAKGVALLPHIIEIVVPAMHGIGHQVAQIVVPAMHGIGHQVAQIVVPVVQGIGHEVPKALTHTGDAVLGESILMVLRPYFERLPFFKAKLHGEHGKELVLNSESVRPEHAQQAIKDIDETLSGLA
jgi:hypothetical protein